MANHAGAQRIRWNWILIAAVAVILIGGAWLFSQIRLARQLDAEAALIAMHQGRLYFADEFSENGDLLEGPIQRGWRAYLFRSPFNLNLYNVKGVGECLKIAATYPGLWQLELSGSDISDQDLAFIRQMHEMRFLLLNNTNIGDAIFDAIAEMPNLETLDLSRTKITAQALAKWRPPASLKTLMLIECDIESQSLVGLKNHSELQTLRLCDTNVTSKCIRELGVLPNLEELDLSGTKVDGDCMDAIAIQKKLQILRLADTKIPSEDLAKFLQKLGRLRELDVSRLSYSDAAMQAVFRIRTLEILTLSGMPITDELSQNFYSMHYLKELAIDDTKMTASGIVKLAENTHIERLAVSTSVLSAKNRDYVSSLRKGIEVIEIPLAPKIQP